MIDLVSVYVYIICVCKKNCNLVNWGSNLPQVVATDFLKLNSPNASRNSGDSA